MINFMFSSSTYLPSELHSCVYSCISRTESKTKILHTTTHNCWAEKIHSRDKLFRPRVTDDYTQHMHTAPADIQKLRSASSKATKGSNHKRE